MASAQAQTIATTKTPAKKTAAKKAADLPQPPRVKGNFVFGSLAEFGADPLGFFSRAMKKHGDVVQFRMGPIIGHVVRHPNDVMRVLQGNHTNYGKQTLGYKKMKLLLGEGLVTADGPHWLRQRRIAQPAFHRERIAGFAEAMVGRTNELLQRMTKAKNNNDTIDFHYEFSETAMEIAGDVFLSFDMSGEANDVAKAMEFVLPYINRLITKVVPFAEIWPTAENKEFKHHAQVLDSLIDGIIEERRQAANAGDELPNDLLTMLLEARDENGETMSDEQLRDEVMTMFMAGHETTANTLSWTMMLLAQNQEWQQALHAEVVEVLGDRDPTLEDLRALPLLDRVVKEGLRLYPAAWGVARSLKDDDVLGGYRIPKGTVVFISPYYSQRNPEFWDQPEVFDPDRFTPENEAKIVKGAYIPFVAGPRQCIGKAFAEMELRILLAMVVRDFRSELVPGYEVKPEPSITLRPGGGVPVSLHSW